MNAAGELEFGVIGEAGERVDVTIVTAEQSSIVLPLPVLLGANGSAEVHCGSTGATTLCTRYPSYMEQLHWHGEDTRSRRERLWERL